ncbi:MAG TPA: ATP-binding cassette domain-containing protein [Chloroflexota bacterium]|nr:ATP-binding cassette domain-containing protein [Chloroflexota bacterium]
MTTEGGTALPMNGQGPVVYEAQHISKSFGAVTALRDVNIKLHKGEVLGLLGDNGAGKSTFIKILTGFYPQDSGHLIFEGRPIKLGSPADARRLGIQTVYQDLALIKDLSVYHNMYLGRELRHWWGLDNHAMKEQTRDSLSRLGIELPSVESTVERLSGGQRQSIAVARSVFSNPKVLFLDEPLAALGVREGRMVIDLVLELKSRGDISIIMIAHNYSHVFEVADRLNFLSGGKIVYDAFTKDTSVAELVELVSSGFRRAAAVEAR